MTYAKQLSEDKLLHLRPTLKAIESLRPGEILLLEDTREALNQLRGDLYTWFWNKGVKPLYKLRRVSPLALEVCRVVAPEPRLTVRTLESKGEEFCKQRLLECDNLEETNVVLKKAVEEGTLTEAESGVALREWLRIQGVF